MPNALMPTIKPTGMSEFKKPFLDIKCALTQQAAVQKTQR